MNIRDKLYENKVTRPLVFSLDLLIGASAIGGVAGCSSTPDRVNSAYDHPEYINVDGIDDVLIVDSEGFDLLPKDIQAKIYDLEVDARQRIILANSPTYDPISEVRLEELMKKRDRILSSLNDGASEWKGKWTLTPPRYGDSRVLTFKYFK